MNFWQNVLLISILIFYTYSVFTNPQLYFSFSTKRFVAYKFFNHRLRQFNHQKPRHLNKIFAIIPWLRESFLIVLRRQSLAKFFKNLATSRKLNYEMIFQKIVVKRFNPRNPYLTSGDHFSSFYPRNLGLFYKYALSPVTCTNLSDYQNRLSMYLNSLHFSLEFYENKSLSTTIVPIWRSVFYSCNIFREPADTLLSILLSLDYLINYKDYKHLKSTSKDWLMATDQASLKATEMLEKYKLDLYTKLLDLLAKINPDLCLIDEKFTLSGIRDGVVRKSSFYDNVCLYKTIELALKLEIVNEEELQSYEIPKNIKKSIIQKFINNKIILDELANKKEILNGSKMLKDCLSADFLIACSLEFFDLNEETEKDYIVNTILAFKEYGLIHKTGIQYSYNNPKNEYWLVKLFAPSYMGKSIWSHWSTELAIVIKVCLNSENTLQREVLQEISKNITDTIYQKVIKYQGYPELYDLNENIYANWFYSSILETGWIVNYEYLRKTSMLKLIN
jgi:hypothetical protein